jgi:hypothetical protein
MSSGAPSGAAPIASADQAILSNAEHTLLNSCTSFRGTSTFQQRNNGTILCHRFLKLVQRMPWKHRLFLNFQTLQQSAEERILATPKRLLHNQNLAPQKPSPKLSLTPHSQKADGEQFLSLCKTGKKNHLVFSSSPDYL